MREGPAIRQPLEMDESGGQRFGGPVRARRRAPRSLVSSPMRVSADAAGLPLDQAEAAARAGSRGRTAVRSRRPPRGWPRTASTPLQRETSAPLPDGSAARSAAIAGADAARFGDLPDGVGQTVAQVHAGARRSASVPAARRGAPAARDAGAARRTPPASGLRAVRSRARRAPAASPDLPPRRRWSRSHTARRPARPPLRVRIRRGLTEPTTVTSTTSGPGDRVMLPPASATPVAAATSSRPSSRPSTSARGSAGGKHEREQREPRRRTHGGDVADVDGERLVADVGGRREAPIEVHALDERVGRQHLQRAAIDDRHRRIVADADDERARRRGKPPADVLDEPALSDGRHILRRRRWAS